MGSAEVKLRRAVALDAAALARLDQLQPWCAHWGEKGWKEEIIQAAGEVWCAQVQEDIVAFCALRMAAGFGEILNVAVHPKYCRQGIATALLRRALADVREQGAEQLTLEVNEHNGAAISLYRKLGFYEVGRRAKFYNAQDDALIMEIKL